MYGYCKYYYIVHSRKSRGCLDPRPVIPPVSGSTFGVDQIGKTFQICMAMVFRLR